MFTLIFDPTISIKIVELISRDTRREIETQQNKKRERERGENFYEKIFDDSRENECFKFRYFEISVENEMCLLGAAGLKFLNCLSKILS